MMLGLIHVSDKHTVVKTILGIFYTNTLVLVETSGGRYRHNTGCWI